VRLLDLAKAAVEGSIRSHKDAERDEVAELGRLVLELHAAGERARDEDAALERWANDPLRDVVRAKA
jgi:hypothetical protein